MCVFYWEEKKGEIGAKNYAKKITESIPSWLTELTETLSIQLSKEEKAVEVKIGLASSFTVCLSF